METTARIGWLTRGAMYLLVAAIVARIPSTATGGREVGRDGAFAALADSQGGRPLLALVAAGLVSFAVLRMWEAWRGHDEKSTRRLGWAGSALVYAASAALAVGVLRGGSGSSGEEQTATATVLDWPAGPWLVGIAGLAMLAVAANALRKGIGERFLRDVDEAAVPGRMLPVVKAVGVAGWLGRALVWALAGWFVIRAAVKHDANEPIGLDASLRRLTAESWGDAVIWVAFAGLLAFGLLCLATAAWPDPDPDG